MYLKRSAYCLTLLILCACGAEQPPYKGIKLGKPYEVYGHWYKPHYDADYDEVGIASWYGPGFHGGRTANGERFDENALTAAHKTLPLPSIVRVTNLDNGLSAIIKVNDRGPFAHSRIIDLSKASAKKLGVIATGTAKVRVQFLERETKEYVENLNNGTQYAMNELKNVNPDEAGENQDNVNKNIALAGNTSENVPMVLPPAPVPTAEQVVPDQGDEFSMAGDNDQTQGVEVAPEPATPAYRPSAEAPKPIYTDPNPGLSGGYFIRAGTFSVEQNARNVIDKLSDADAPEAMEITIGGKKFYRVMLGPYETMQDAKNMLSKLKAMGISDAKIIHN